MLLMSIFTLNISNNVAQDSTGVELKYVRGSIFFLEEAHWVR